MAIVTDLLPLRRRSRVAWFQDTPPVDGKRAFEERSFVVTSCTDEDLRTPAYLAGLAAVVLVQNAEKVFQIRQRLVDHARRLLDYDCGVVVRPHVRPGVNGLPIITRVVDELRLPTAGLSRANDGDPTPLPFVNVYNMDVPWNDIANFVAVHPPDRAPATCDELTISVKDKHGRDVKLSPDSELLIRRAFADCAEVHLVPMDDEGRSGVSVYRAYTELVAGHLGLWPLPYFVKVGERAKILAEYRNYVDYVDPYIPFHLGPHLVHERCCLGACEGVIVGDYVEESESLLRCARDGRSASAIACLFDRTLRGWHRSTRLDSRPLPEMLVHQFPREIPARRLARARELGGKEVRDVGQLRVLFERCTSTPVLVGPIHGDLHAANVRVRATDAIVIDFYAHREAPLVYDAACLEASLLVEGFANDRIGDIHAWLRSIEALYDHVSLNIAPAHANPKNVSSWFHSCVRQIRLYARQMEYSPHQYAAALGVALLAKAGKDPRASEPEASRRAAAYVLAERVLSTISEPKVKAS